MKKNEDKIIKEIKERIKTAKRSMDRCFHSESLLQYYDGRIGGLQAALSVIEEEWA